MSARDVERLSTLLDGALPPAEARALEAEIAARPELAGELRALREQDRTLRQAFAPLRHASLARAEALATVLARRPAPEPAAGRTGPRAWAWIAVGFAAGVLVTSALLRGVTPGPAHPPTGAPPLAELERALGSVEAAGAEGAPAALLAEGAALAPGALVRTPERSRCTLLLADGSRLRLDGGTELVLAGERHVELRRGRLYAEIRPAAERFRADAGASEVEVVGTRLDLAQRIAPAGSADAGHALTELAVLEGRALLCGTPVEAGSLATAVDGTFAHARAADDLLLLTSWVNELIAFEPDHAHELQERVDALLAMLGRSKMEFLYEGEIRSLGDHCALPLLRYVESEGSLDEVARRRDAARILADVAAPEHEDGLAGLLTDPDPEVRTSAARGLVRLTGGFASGVPEDFAGPRWAELAAAWRAELARR